ncbi:hypothetical protein PilKf_01837 [Pillotina sp. SPG140]|jgi:hypothetical protein
MALEREALKQVLQTAVHGQTTAESAVRAFGERVLAYICSALEIVYTWSAVSPDGKPDPVGSFSATVQGTGILTPAESFQQWLLHLSDIIRALTIVPAAGFTLALSFNPSAVVTVTMQGEDTFDTAYDTFCDQLITSIRNAYVNPTPCAGTHGIYVGATTGMQLW